MVGIKIKITSQTLMIYVLRNTIFYWHGNNQPTRRPTWPESFDNRWHINEWLYLSPLVLLLCTERPLVCILLCIQSSARENGFFVQAELGEKNQGETFLWVVSGYENYFMPYIRKHKNKCVRWTLLYCTYFDKHLERIIYCC